MTAADTHVHLHPCHDPWALLCGAAANLAAATGPDGLRPEAGALCFTDAAGADARARILADAAAGAPATVERCADGVSLRVRGLALPLWLLPGRQVVAREGLEILSVGATADWPDGELDLGALAAEVRAAGGCPVLPWGPGKWWGRRGRCLKELLARADRPALGLGDNGGRPRVWPEPRLLRQARAAGIPVLPGSDPLPFPGEEATAGCCAVALEGTPDAEAPARTLADALVRGAFRPLAPAGRETLGRFVRNQWRMQRRKRSRR